LKEKTTSTDVLPDKPAPAAIPPAHRQSLIPFKKPNHEIEVVKNYGLEKIEWQPWNIPRTVKWLSAAIGYLMGVVGFIALFFPWVAGFRDLRSLRFSITR
jgi:hypothetical protein